MSDAQPWASNPFATRHVRPGSIPYLFDEGESAERLVEQLACQNWWGEIVGPHGSGKSTLLHSLAPVMREAGRELVWFTCRAGQRHLPLSSPIRRTWNPQSQMIVDGYEQLSRWSRWRLKRACQRAGAGLLITAHQSVGLPPLATVTPQAERTHRVVTHLLADNAPTLPPERIDQLFQQHQGNVREVLFKLYDWYEQQRREKA